jgi:hypothetical protein
MRQRLLPILAIFALFSAACSQDNPVPAAVNAAHGDDFEVEFTVKLENRSQGKALSTALGSGVWMVVNNTATAPLFNVGQTVSPVFETLAEAGNPAPALTALVSKNSPRISGTLQGPINPSVTASFTFKARPGDYLTFATMVSETNDVVLAPAEQRIALFDADNEPIKGDVSSQLALWDAGTEVNQEPGKGADQAARQTSPTQGTAEAVGVQLVSARNDGFSYPAMADLAVLTVENNDDHDDHDH